MVNPPTPFPSPVLPILCCFPCKCTKGSVQGQFSRLTLTETSIYLSLSLCIPTSPLPFLPDVALNRISSHTTCTGSLKNVKAGLNLKASLCPPQTVPQCLPLTYLFATRCKQLKRLLNNLWALFLNRFGVNFPKPLSLSTKFKQTKCLT